MKICHDDLQPLVHGALKTSETPAGWIHFDRLPDPLLPVYAENPGAMTRLLSPAGVRLRFRSNTQSIRLTLRYFTFARPCFQGALAIDQGVPQPFGPEEACERWEGELIHSPDSEDHDFELWMPHLCHTEIESFVIDDGATLCPLRPPSRRWLAYGDSITQGMTVANPAESLMGIATRELEADILNLGVGGGKVVQKMKDTIPDWEYDFVSIAYGTNDFNHGTPVPTYEANLRALVEALHRKHPTKPIIVISVIPWAGRTEPNRNGDLLSAFRESAERVADECEGAWMISGPGLIDNNADLFVDNVHPNEAGMKMYGLKFAAAIKRLTGQ